MINMNVKLKLTEESDFHRLYEIRKSAFLPLYERYQDHETTPVNECFDSFVGRIHQGENRSYTILYKDSVAGFIRLRPLSEERCHVSEICVSPEYQGLGIAQQVFPIVEALYPQVRIWELSTIMQEKRNCYLYEKLGYKRLDETKKLNELTTLVYYEKHIIPAT